MQSIFNRRRVLKISKSSAKLIGVVSVTFIGLLLVTFLIGRVVPIDPVLAVVGDKASSEVYEKAYHEMGLHLPLYQQFFIYIQKVLKGDFGSSVLTANMVLDDIIRVFPATFELATIATIFGVLIGIPLGVLSAVHSGSILDQVTRVVGLFGYSLPIFWLGLMGLMIFYANLSWLPGPGRIDVFYEGLVDPVTGVMLIDCALANEWEIFWNALYHLLLPALLLGYYSMAYISRMTRSFMLEQLRQEYILTARVKGVPEWKVIWNHALGNCLIPLITVVALSFGGLLEGSVLTETVFAWPGLGLYLTRSLLNADMNAVLGSTLVVGTIFLTINLFSDFMYKVVDPRAR